MIFYCRRYCCCAQRQVYVYIDCGSTTYCTNEGLNIHIYCINHLPWQLLNLTIACTACVRLAYTADSDLVYRVIMATCRAFHGKGKKMLNCLIYLDEGRTCFLIHINTYEVASALVIPFPIATCRVMIIIPYCRRHHQQRQLSSSSRPKVVVVIEVMAS